MRYTVKVRGKEVYLFEDEGRWFVGKVRQEVKTVVNEFINADTISRDYSIVAFMSCVCATGNFSARKSVCSWNKEVVRSMIINIKIGETMKFSNKRR